jgi:hypothetical protein
MTKLHQILAVEKDIRSTTNRRITDGYQQLQRPGPLSGLARVYTPKDEDGDYQPPESTLVQVSARTVLNDSREQFEQLWDVVATKDFGNLHATADIILEDETVLAGGVPTTYLLWLEKELNDLHTVVSKLPVLDPSEEWTWSDENDAYVTNVTRSVRTKKVPKAFVKAPATDKHPAQVEVFTEDVQVGTWETRKFSGALPAAEVREMTDRVNAVRKAVKEARSRANETDITQQHVAAPILDYIFNG